MSNAGLLMNVSYDTTFYQSCHQFLLLTLIFTLPTILVSPSPSLRLKNTDNQTVPRYKRILILGTTATSYCANQSVTAVGDGFAPVCPGTRVNPYMNIHVQISRGSVFSHFQVTFTDYKVIAGCTSIFYFSMVLSIRRICPHCFQTFPDVVPQFRVGPSSLSLSQ